MQVMPKRRLIGVLGGMGPLATVDFMAKIAAATPVGVDQDHVPLIVHNVPQIPDRSAAIEARSDAPFLPMLAGLRMLAGNGAEYIAIPCNTAHYWHERLQRACCVKILHIADAVIEDLQRSQRQFRKLVLLATRGTISARIYQDRLSRSGIQSIIPNENTQNDVDRIIALVKAGDVAVARRMGEKVMADLAPGDDGAFLLACTELPVAYSNQLHDEHVIDATSALAAACVRASMEEAGTSAASEF